MKIKAYQMSRSLAYHYNLLELKDRGVKTRQKDSRKDVTAVFFASTWSTAVPPGKLDKIITVN